MMSQQRPGVAMRMSGMRSRRRRRSFFTSTPPYTTWAEQSGSGAVGATHRASITRDGGEGQQRLPRCPCARAGSSLRAHWSSCTHQAAELRVEGQHLGGLGLDLASQLAGGAEHQRRDLAVRRPVGQDLSKVTCQPSESLTAVKGPREATCRQFSPWTAQDKSLPSQSWG